MIWSNRISSDLIRTSKISIISWLHYSCIIFNGKRPRLTVSLNSQVYRLISFKFLWFLHMGPLSTYTEPWCSWHRISDLHMTVSSAFTGPKNLHMVPAANTYVQVYLIWTKILFLLVCFDFSCENKKKTKLEVE